MKIAIRMDDITPKMDWEKFEKFKTLLEEYQIKPLIGVVPDNQDENLNRGRENKDFWQYISRLQESGWCIAQHGYQHVYTQKRGGCFPLNHFSEFAGLELSRQKEMLARGKEILESHGITTDLFMAPAHSYDKNTLRALMQLGFRRITDGFGTLPYERHGLLFYPIAFRLENARKKKNGMTTMVVHSNTMSEKDLQRYREIFETGQVISFRDYLEVPPVRRGAAAAVAEYLMAGMKQLLVRFL